MIFHADCLSNCYSIYTRHCGMPEIFYKVNNFLLIGWVYRIVCAINNNYAKDTLILRMLHKHWQIKSFRGKKTTTAKNNNPRHTGSHRLPVNDSPVTQNNPASQATWWRAASERGWEGNGSCHMQGCSSPGGGRGQQGQVLLPLVEGHSLSVVR